MKQKIATSFMVLLLVFAMSGSALAAQGRGRNINSYQWSQTQFRGNNYQSGTYGMNSHQTYTASAQSSKGFFPDLSQNYWAYPMIKQMNTMGVIKGDPDGKFYPDRQVTRAEFATMLVQALHLPADQTAAPTFVDVPSSFWGFQNIEAAQNYLTGYQASGGQLYFYPQNPAVREDVIVALVRAEGLGNEQPDLSVLSNYTDANMISSNLKGYVAIAIQHNLVEGSVNQTGQYSLNPQSKLTRAEAAAFLYRIMGNNTAGQQTGSQTTSQQDNKVIIGQQSGSQTVTQQTPQLLSATSSGTTLTLNYNESLDTSSIPSSGDFTVIVNGIAQTPPTGITVSGSSVSMILYQAIPSASTVTINYTPGVYPIRSLNGYNAPSLVNCQVSTPNTDITPPAWPQGSALSISNQSATGLTLVWPQATDSSGLAAYRVYMDGNIVTTVTGTVNSYNVTGLLPNTTHTFRVDAGDAAGNWSTGPSVSVTTNQS